jgi:hypothetical protein
LPRIATFFRAALGLAAIFESPLILDPLLRAAFLGATLFRFALCFSLLGTPLVGATLVGAFFLGALFVEPSLFGSGQLRSRSCLTIMRLVASCEQRTRQSQRTSTTS